MPKKVPENKLEALAAGIANGQALVTVAESIGIAESTARRWKSDPSFDKRVRSIRAQISGRTIGSYIALRLKGAEVLGKLLDNSDPDIQLKAVVTINRDLLAMSEREGGAVSAGAPGIIVPGLDTRWQNAGDGGATDG
jgi:hypothetical protein